VVAVPLRLPADWLTPGANLAHETRCPAVGNRARVDADLGDEQVRGGLADPGDLIQPVDRLGERADQRLDPGVERGDVAAQRVDPVQHPGQQEAVMVGEEPGERLRQQRPLGPHPRTGQLRQPLGVAFPGQQRGQHGPPRHPEAVAGDHAELDLGVHPAACSTRCFSAVRAATRSTR
jgi:hypothetical protein